MSGVISDTADAYRLRLLHIAIPQLFGAAGVIFGYLVYGRGWTAVAVVTGAALLSGMISTIGAVASVSGLAGRAEHPHRTGGPQRHAVRHGAPPSSLAEIAQVAVQLRGLADTVRQSKTPPPLHTDLTGPADSVLEPLRQEVAAARTIAAPH